MADRRQISVSRGVLVIGLNRFGGQVADTLTRLGREVLAIDENPTTVQRWSERLTYVVQADATDETALRQIGVSEFPRAVVAMGTSVETSVLTVVGLAEIGVPQIWARAISDKHAKILSSVGASHVIFPEAAMGDRVAHLMTSRMIDFIEFSHTFAIAEIRAPQHAAGRVVGESDLRPRYGVTVVAVRPPGGDFSFATRDTPIPADSLLVVAGTPEQLQRIADAP